MRITCEKLKLTEYCHVEQHEGDEQQDDRPYVVRPFLEGRPTCSRGYSNGTGSITVVNKLLFPVKVNAFRKHFSTVRMKKENVLYVHLYCVGTVYLTYLYVHLYCVGTVYLTYLAAFS